MIGYLDIKSYCEISGVPENTVYQRKQRGQIPYIKGEDDLYYFYYNDENGPIDGYVSIREYSALHKVSQTAIRKAIANNRFKENDVICCRSSKKQSRTWYYYIRRDAEYPKYDFVNGAKMMTRHNAEEYKNLCPYNEGYITLKEWADKYNMLLSTTRVYAYTGKLPTKRVDKYLYILKDYAPSFKRLKKEEAAQ